MSGAEGRTASGLELLPHHLFASSNGVWNAGQSLQRLHGLRNRDWPARLRITTTSLTRKPVVDWFEIISENFMIDGGRPLRILDQILEQYKVVQHGVSMYFGSAETLESRASRSA